MPVASEALALRGPPAPSAWETHKDAVKELYMDQNHNLNQVVEKMRVAHDFNAT